MNFERFFRKHHFKLILIGLLLYYFFLRKDRPDFIIKDFDFIFSIFLFLYLFTKSEIDKYKSRSPKLVSNPITSTIAGNPYTFSEDNQEYKLFRLGGIDSDFVKIDGTDGVLIGFSDATIQKRDSFIVNGIAYEKEFEDLPHEAKRYIKHFKLYPPYYMSEVSAYDFSTKEQYNTTILSNLRRIISQQNDLLQDKNKSVEEIAKVASNMFNSMSKPPKQTFFGLGGSDKND
jgi:hypothetical protein